MRDEFIRAIRSRLKVQVTFFSRDDQSLVTRKCAPMDYGPSRRTRAQDDRYHLWDYESDTGQHTLSLNPEQIKQIVVLDEWFEPAEFITWPTNWFVERDWGKYS